ncbi:MAG TPA: S41 family peptidase [Dictyobacter sp.]|nr:S41 family peptidase [Dictyobacter sp.]
MNRYDDPHWYEEQQPNANQLPSQQPAHNDFDNYPFLPAENTPTQSTQNPPRSRLQRSLGRIIGIPALVIVGFLVGWFGHQYFSDSYAFSTQSQQSKAYEQLFDQAWAQVDQNYVDRKDINYQQMSYAAINAMVTTLGDTGHSRFMTPQEVQTENQQLSGTYTGVGIYLQQDPTTKQLIVTAPIPGSPAAKAGIKHGDIITAVNGVSTTGKDINSVSALIQGKSGTTVTITVKRAGDAQPLNLKMTRAQIEAPNVTMDYISSSHTADIQIVQFADGVSGQVKTDVEQAKKEGATNIVLDLRDNPGGYLNEAVNTVSLFVGSGNVLLEQDSTGQRTPVPVNGHPIDTTTPMVVLVNGNSASAAEITAGALKDNHRATIIGETTFGTGTVLEPFQLADGSQLLLGTQEWLTPDGQFIRRDDATHYRGGITPNQTVAMSAKNEEILPTQISEDHMTLQQLINGNDPQLSAALKFLTKQK